MTKFVKREIKGEKFGDRTALGESLYKKMPSGRNVIMEKCRCKCGVEKYVQRQHLFSGCSTGCGCTKRKKTSILSSIMNRKHGMEGTAPYKKYMSAKARCKDKNNDSYYRYGGRGIKMLWSDFSEFWKDMGDSYQEHVKQYGEKETTLERIDVDGDYCKENCRRATRAEQYENTTNNHAVSYKGKQFPTIARLCKETGTNYGLVRDRIRHGWTVEDAVDKPLLKKYKPYVKEKKRLRTKGNYIQQTPHFTSPSLW